MIELTQEYVRSLFDYRDGELYWRVSNSNRVKVGDLVGSDHGDGYRIVMINRKNYRAHRLIFLYHHGYVPEFLDHIDGNPINNNIFNLRPATHQENMMNQKKTKSVNGKSTSSKYKGVYWNKQHKKWRSRITIDGKQKHLGKFTSEIDAALAYDRASYRAFGVFARLNFPIYHRRLYNL